MTSCDCKKCKEDAWCWYFWYCSKCVTELLDSIRMDKATPQPEVGNNESTKPSIGKYRGKDIANEMSREELIKAVVDLWEAYNGLNKKHHISILPSEYSPSRESLVPLDVDKIDEIVKIVMEWDKEDKVIRWNRELRIKTILQGIGTTPKSVDIAALELELRKVCGINLYPNTSDYEYNERVYKERWNSFRKILEKALL